MSIRRAIFFPETTIKTNKPNSTTGVSTINLYSLHVWYTLYIHFPINLNNLSGVKIQNLQKWLRTYFTIRTTAKCYVKTTYYTFRMIIWFATDIPSYIRGITIPVYFSELSSINQWRSEDFRGPWTTDSLGPLLTFHNLIALTPPPTYTPTQTLHTFISIIWFWIRHFLISTYLMVYFGNLGPFDDSMGEVGVPWWRNDKWYPLITWWEIRGHNGGTLKMQWWIGAPWYRDGNLEVIILMTWGNWGPLMALWKI